MEYVIQTLKFSKWNTNNKSRSLKPLFFKENKQTEWFFTNKSVLKFNSSRSVAASDVLPAPFSSELIILTLLKPTEGERCLLLPGYQTQPCIDEPKN